MSNCFSVRVCINNQTATLIFNIGAANWHLFKHRPLMFASPVFLVYQALIPPTPSSPRLSIKSVRPAPRTARSPAPARRAKNAAEAAVGGKRVNRGRSLKMAASLSSTRLAAALAPAPPSAKIPHSKATASAGSPDGSRSHCSRDFNPPPPPPKKLRVEERSVKPKKLHRDGAGVGGSGREKLLQPARSCGSGGSWNVSPIKSCGGAGGTSSNTNSSGSAPAASQPPTHALKLFKQSDFFLHKAPPPLKPKKSGKDKLREKDKSKGGDEETRKHKVFPAANHGGDLSTSSGRLNNSTVLKRENGEVTSSLPKGRPQSQFKFHLTLSSEVVTCVHGLCTTVGSSAASRNYFVTWHVTWEVRLLNLFSLTSPPPPPFPVPLRGSYKAFGRVVPKASRSLFDIDSNGLPSRVQSTLPRGR